jgi:hypothetical protein
LSPIDLSINHVCERCRSPHQCVIVPSLCNSLRKLQGSSIGKSLHFEVWSEISCGKIHRVLWTCSETHINFIPSSILVEVASSHYKKCKKESSVIVFIEEHRGFPFEYTILKARLGSKMSTRPICALGLLTASCGGFLTKFLCKSCLQTSLPWSGIVWKRYICLNILRIIPCPSRNILVKLHSISESIVWVSGSAQRCCIKLLEISFLISIS